MHCLLWESRAQHAAEAGQPAVCLLFSTAEPELVSPELSDDAGCKGILVWVPCCANEAVLPGGLRCCIRVVLFHGL